jgi:cysteine-rich repeat protein
MRRRLIQLVFMTCIIGLAVPAFPGTGRDLRSCYSFSDTFPPVAPDAPAADFVPIAGLATPLTLGDDTPSAPIPLPFVFKFFGQPYIAVTVSPNGFLKLGAAEVPTARWPRGTELPDARSPNGVIAGVWKDLDPSRGGTIVWAVVGAAPQRRFVVQFTDVPDRDRPGVLNTFQIALAETTDDIVVRYAGASGSDLGAVAGVESESGAAGITWLLNDFALDRAAVRYTPLGIDTDGDGWSDCVDTCRLVSNFTQLDSDLNGTGDACELSSPPITVGPGVPPDEKDKNIDASRPDVAVDGLGDALVVWDAPIDRARGIQGRWYDATGTPRTGAFLVNTPQTQKQMAPRAAMMPGGDVAVVTWGSSGDTSTVRMRDVAGDGTPGPEQVLAQSTFATMQPAIVADARGPFAVAWGARYTLANRPLQIQRFDAFGQAVGDMLEAGRVTSPPPQPNGAFGMAGDLTVAWRSELGTLRMRRFDVNGVPFTDDVVDFAVAVDGRGPRMVAGGASLFVAWGGLGQVSLQRFDDGLPAFASPLVLETGAGEATNPAVAMAGPGSLFVVWEQGGRILGQRLAIDGLRPLERPASLSASPDPTAVHAMPAVATTSDGHAAVTWRETHDGVVDVVLRQLQRCGNGNVDPGEQCDDGNATAGDCCSPACQFEPEGQACDDGLFCTLDSVCTQGACVAGTLRTCGDGNACTADRCDEPTGQCVFDAAVLTGASCDDGNACTQQDTCGAGACQGQPVVCDDGNACTADACDPASGCLATNLDGAACDDGDGCTDGDVCGAGACGGSRVCGARLPDGPIGGGSAGKTPELPVAGKGIVKVECQSQEPGTCAGTLYGVDAATGGQGQALSKTKRRRIGKKKNTVKLKLKLTKSGRSALAASGDRLPAVLELTIVGRPAGTRRTSVRVTLIPPGR